MIKVYTILIFLLSINLKGQDVHYSQFDKTKLLINPSLIANQKNDYEIQLQKRSQWASVTKPFNTFSLSFSTKNIYKNISLGAMILNDVSGDSDFSTDGFAVSFIKSINTKENLFSISLQTALYQRAVNYEELVFIESENLQIRKFSFFDIGVGVSNYKKLNKNSYFLAGISSNHLNKPSQSLSSSNTSRLNLKHIFHSTYYTSLSAKTDISPTGYFSFQNQQQEIVIGSGVVYELNDEVSLISGIYNRLKDAFVITFGMEKNNLQAIVSYDINTSSLSSASNYNGGVEISINYGWSIEREKKKEKQKKCLKYL